MSDLDKCPEHGSTFGRQDVRRVVVDRDVPYPRPNQGETEGDASEIECPWCGLAESIDDEVERGQFGFTCTHCGKEFEVTETMLMVKTRKVTT